MLGNAGSTSKDVVKSADIPAKETPAWQEVKSDDGNIYYWNTQTNGKGFLFASQHTHMVVCMDFCIAISIVLLLLTVRCILLDLCF